MSGRSSDLLFGISGYWGFFVNISGSLYWFGIIHINLVIYIITKCYQDRTHSSAARTVFCSKKNLNSGSQEKVSFNDLVVSG